MTELIIYVDSASFFFNPSLRYVGRLCPIVLRRGKKEAGERKQLGEVNPCIKKVEKRKKRNHKVADISASSGVP